MVIYNSIMPNLWLVFTTGLLTGGISCLAVQGGLLASLIASRKGEDVGQAKGLVDTGIFLLAKLVAYTLLGVALGWLGSVFVPSPRVLGTLQLIAAVYMMGVAGALLNVHPIFRHFILQPPRFLNRLVRNQSRRKEVFAPAFLGAATIFIPCGTTQAMMAQAVATANPLWGGLVMAVFVLGTSPLFLAIGLSVAKLGDFLKGSFAKAAAFLVVIVALVNLNGSLVILNSPLHLAKMERVIECVLTICDDGRMGNVIPTDTISVNIASAGYTLDKKVIKAGEKVTLKLTNTDGTGCQQAFTIPALGISRIVGVGRSDEISFVAPSDPGTLAFSCSMGMYSGEIAVVN